MLQLGKEVAVPAIHGAESAPQAADPGTPAAPAAVPYGDDIVGYGSDDDPDTFTDVEDAIMGAKPGGQAASAEVLARRRQGIAAARGSVLELERLASAVSAQYLDAQGGCSLLCYCCLFQRLSCCMLEARPKSQPASPPCLCVAKSCWKTAVQSLDVWQQWL